MALVDTDALESLLAEADRLAVALHGDNENQQGFIQEIRSCVECVEDAIKDLGGAYEAETQAAERLESAKQDIDKISKSLSQTVVRDIQSSKDGLRSIISKIIHDSISQESENIVSDLSSELKRSLVHDIYPDSVRTVLGKNVESVTKQTLAQKVKSLEAQQAVYKEHYKEANFWRTASKFLIPVFFIGTLSFAMLGVLIYMINTGQWNAPF